MKSFYKTSSGQWKRKTEKPNKPVRNITITKDEITNLVIDLGTSKDSQDFIEKL